MGRWSTGATTTRATQRLELSWLIKNEYFPKGRYVTGSLSWTSDDAINYSCDRREGKFRVHLDYVITTKSTGEQTQVNYDVQLVSVPSNLGKGEVWYFVCPVSGKRARVLYRAYGSQYFKHRDTYRQRIYYPCQKESKTYRVMARKNTISDNIDKMLNEAQIRPTYKGKKTKRAQRLDRLRNKYFDCVQRSNQLIMERLYR